MAKPKAYVVNGLGIGCHEEAAHAFTKAGAKAKIIHIKQLLSMSKEELFNSQIINLPGGFLHGDMLGAGFCAANEIEHAGFKDWLVEYAEKGNVVYGQCNGFQLLVKTGLLPGTSGQSKQTVTLTHNDCGNYRVAPVLHLVEREHFAFEGIEDNLYLWCRHGEGKIMFYSDLGLVPREEGEVNRKLVNESHVLLRYANPFTREPTEEFPYNPNGSVDGIAGLVSSNGNIFGHMAHPEVSIYITRNPEWFFIKDQLRRRGIKATDLEGKMLEGIGYKIFRNIVRRF